MKKQKLLENPEVIKEIKRHLWIESEKKCRDLGFEWATEDWLKRFSKAWVNVHMPKKKSKKRKGFLIQ